MKTSPQHSLTSRKIKGKFTVAWLEYPTGQNNRFGAGGWSRHALRPKPVLVKHELNGSQIQFSGKSVLLTIDGQLIRKLRCNIQRKATGETLREDYDLSTF